MQPNCVVFLVRRQTPKQTDAETSFFCKFAVYMPRELVGIADQNETLGLRDRSDRHGLLHLRGLVNHTVVKPTRKQAMLEILANRCKNVVLFPCFSYVIYG